MANVYRAYDPEIQRELAIKILNQQYRRDPECVERFLREARAAGALSHPNIVTIYDVGEIQGFPYIAMELLNGVPLDKAMETRGAFAVSDVLAIGKQLADALRYAHDLGIVHRDIKPSNIILHEDGRSIKILDFGIARVAQRGDADVLKTQIGQVLGTPRYMSPEQALGQALDGRSDIFSVGVVLYELLTGKPAFSGSSVATLALQIATLQPEAISTPDCPRGLRFIIEKLLSKRPEKRFANGAQLADALLREEQSWSAVRTEGKNRRLPLHARFALLTTAIVCGVLALSISTVLDQQFKAMERVALTSGASIATFVANNAALPLAENAAKPPADADWLPVQAFVNTASADRNITQMMIVDRNGTIRAAGDQLLIGTSYSPPNNQKLSGVDAGVSVSSVHNAEGREAYRFTRPITYAGRSVGRVDLTMRKDELAAAANLARTLLVGLGALMLAVVFGISFLAGRLVLSPIRRLNRALREAAGGDLDFRLSHARRDEFGELFDNFNTLVGSVQPRREAAPAPEKSSSPTATIVRMTAPEAPLSEDKATPIAATGGRQ